MPTSSASDSDSPQHASADQRRQVRSRLWREGRLVEENFAIERLSEYLAEPDCLVWVDLCDPDHRQLDTLAEELQLQPLAVEDAISRRERAKLTRYASHSFLTAAATRIVVGPSDERDDDGTPPQYLQLDPISAFVLHRGIVTVRVAPGFDIADLTQRWDDNADLLQYGVGALLHGLLDQIVDSHFDTVQAMDEAIESVEDELFAHQLPNSRIVQRGAYRTRRDLERMRRVVLPMREVVSAAMRQRREHQASTELDPWFEDLYDHVLRVADWTDSLRDMVATIFETNLSLENARLNDVMKKLTGWAAIIAVPTAVTGFYGQNVPYPGYNTHVGFIVSVVVMATIAIGLFVTFRLKKWI